MSRWASVDRDPRVRSWTVGYSRSPTFGAASPHGRYWPEFFAAFLAAIVALRVLIAWVYVNTSSLRMAQLLHASSTGFLVVLGAPRATPGQESLWYFAYAAVLWAVVIVVVALQGNTLSGRLRTRRQRRASITATAGS